MSSSPTVFSLMLLPLILMSAFADVVPARADQSSLTTQPAKVQELVKLLGDPEVRAWLATKPSASADDAAGKVVSGIVAWEEIIHHHLVRMRNALPHLPVEAMNAVRLVGREIGERGFAAMLVLFGVILVLGSLGEKLFRRVLTGARRKAAGHPHSGAVAWVRAERLLSEVAPLIVFAFVIAAGLFAFEWPVLLRAVIFTYLVAVIGVRSTMALGRAVLAPDEVVPADGGTSLRLLSIGNAEARFWYRRLTFFAPYGIFGWATVSLLPELDFSPDAQDVIGYILGIGLLALSFEVVWRRPGAARTNRHAGAVNWLLTVYLLLLWWLWVSGLTGGLWLAIYALLLPRVLNITGQAAEALTEQRKIGASSNSVRTVLIVRGVRAFVILLAVLWLSLLFDLDPGVLAQNNAFLARVMRGALSSIVILLAADLFWQLAKAYIDRELQTADADEAAGPVVLARRARVRTLLPIFRNALAVAVGVVAVLMVLAELGMQIAPLIAGAGVFGIAIGFGAQTLVKDIISGIFYMLDDAFRIGEYIQSREYMGTVESFSLRSVRLRHHRGPVFTVPFGELGAVQNMSRDWAIDKLSVSVDYQTDIEQARNIINEIGRKFAEDPEYASGIIEPLKLQGVENFGDFGITLTLKMKTKPGQQFVMRRQAYAEIKKAFEQNGIKIPFPTVTIKEGESAAAAAASALARERATRVTNAK